jgi:DNA-binding CsgD family transcriptional regulator
VLHASAAGASHEPTDERENAKGTDDRQWYVGLLTVLNGSDLPADCLCMSLQVHQEMSAVVVLIRTRQAQRFVDRERRSFEQIQPALAHLFRSAALRQGVISPGGTAPASSTLPERRRRMTTDQILAKLTRTECQVLGYLRLAATEREISKQVHRSPHTVHVHVKNIYRKLNVSSRGQLLDLFGQPSELTSVRTNHTGQDDGQQDAGGPSDADRHEERGDPDRA